MNNKVISPLYIYTKDALETKRINKRTMQKAFDVLTNAIDNCCFPRHKVTVNGFLNTFYILLNGMNRKISLHKIEAVSELLAAAIECCTL